MVMTTPSRLRDHHPDAVVTGVLELMGSGCGKGGHFVSETSPTGIVGSSQMALPCVPLGSRRMPQCITMPKIARVSVDGCRAGNTNDPVPNGACPRWRTARDSVIFR